MIIVPVSLDPNTGTPIVPDEVKQRVRNGERISIEILPQVNGFAKNALRHGVAGLNIDACRIATEDKVQASASGGVPFGCHYEKGTGAKYQPDGHGRWPSNVLLDEAAAALLDEQSGERKGATSNSDSGADARNTFNKGWTGREKTPGYADTGGASRYFLVVKNEDNTGVTQVAESDTLMYNIIQEVSLCNEIASIAESLLTHDRQMSHGDSVDFAAENVDTPTKLSLGIIGTTLDQMKADGTSNGESLGAERCIQDGAPSGSGSKPTGHFQRDMTSIISTTTKLMTVWRTSKPSQDGNTRNYTARLEQIIESLTALSSDDANDATSTSRLQSSLSELLALTTAIASHAAVRLLQNGERKTENTLTPTCANTTGVSGLRFAYVAKASSSERNEGLQGMEKRPAASTSNGGIPGKTMTVGAASLNGEAKAPPMVRNHHPTVKPLELMRWLCRLTKTPWGGVVLDPFAGSGSTGVAAVLEGRSFIGIDTEAEYLAIAEARLAAASAQPFLFEVT